MRWFRRQPVEDEAGFVLSERQAVAALGALWWVTTQTNLLPYGSKEMCDAWEALAVLGRRLVPKEDLNAAVMISWVDQMRADLNVGSQQR